MREFEGRKLRSIATEDIRRFLARLDREDICARTGNVHGQILHSVFGYARRRAARPLPVMGHSKPTTTERYLHSKPRPDDVAKLTRVIR